MDAKTKRSENHMKNLFRIFAPVLSPSSVFKKPASREPTQSRPEALGSLTSFLNPRQIHTTKTGRASEALRRKSLIINDQILHPPPKSSGNVRFCLLIIPAHPGPIR